MTPHDSSSPFDPCRINPFMAPPPAWAECVSVLMCGSHSPSHTHNQTHAHTHTHAPSRTRTHTPLRTRTHTSSRTHTHTHTHARLTLRASPGPVLRRYQHA